MSEAAIMAVDPDNRRYKDIDIDPAKLSSRKQSMLFYNELVEAYNGRVVGSILLIPMPKGFRFHNLKPILKGRGLVPERDFFVTLMKEDADGNRLPKSEFRIKLKKLTGTVGKVIDIPKAQQEDDLAGPPPTA